MSEHAIILFDGVCNLCNGFVQFVINRDPHAYFKFGALQSARGRQLLQQRQLGADFIDSIVLIEDNAIHLKSDAALLIAKHLSGGWRFCAWLRIIPLAMRNRVYDLIAKNRYRWFGKQDQCLLPTPALQRRFID